MTVIAWDGKTLAADKRGTRGGLPVTVTKIRRIGDVIAGVSGNAAHVGELFKWIENGCKHSDYPEFQKDEDENSTLIVIRDDRCFIYTSTAYPVEIEDNFFASGSGRDFAIAAMHLKLNAVEAVRVACLFDINCGNGIEYLEV